MVYGIVLTTFEDFDHVTVASLPQDALQLQLLAAKGLAASEPVQLPANMPKFNWGITQEYVPGTIPCGDHVDTPLEEFGDYSGNPHNPSEQLFKAWYIQEYDPRKLLD